MFQLVLIVCGILIIMTSFSINRTFFWLFLLALAAIQIAALPFVEQSNIPITIPTGETLLDNQIEVLNSSLIVYYITRTSDNTTIKINRFTIAGTSHTQQSCTLFDNLHFKSPIFNVLLTSLSLFYTNQNSGTYRLIINKQTLAITSNTSKVSTFHGIYSYRWDDFFYANQYYSTGIYNHIEDLNPAYLYVGNKNYNGPIYFFLGSKEDVLVSLFQSDNFIEIRKLINSTQIINQFGNPKSISIQNGGCQCLCQSNDGTIIYLLDSRGDLVTIIVSTNSASTTKFGIFGPNKCYQEKSTGLLVLMSESLSLNQTTVGYINLRTMSYTTYKTYNFSNIKFTRDNSYFTSMNSTNLIVNAINTPSCLSAATYYDTSSLMCLNCNTNCLSCTSLANCSTCNTGYVIDASGGCSLPVAGNNSTNSSTTTNNSTTNSTSNNSTTTNSTSKNSTNSTNTTNFSSNSTSNSSLLTNNSLESNYAIETIDLLLGNVFITTMNRVPASRRVFSFLFYYFSNFDDFWLYQYHDRDYGRTMNALFSRIQSLQAQKWSVIDADFLKKIQAWVQSDQTDIVSVLDRPSEYSSFRFYEVESHGEGFLVSCWDYLTINLVMVLALFLILRYAFRALFNFRVSQNLRPFSFWGYLGLIMIDGNLQFFFFLLFSENKLAFSLSPTDKMLTVAQFLTFFFCLWFTFSCYFLFYIMYKKLAKYFYDNYQCNIQGIFGLVAGISLRSLVLGAIHNLFRNDFRCQLLYLALAQIFFTGLSITHHKLSRGYREVYKLWLTVLFSLLRLSLQGALYCQQAQTGDSQTAELIQSILGAIVITYMYLYYAGVVMVILKSIDCLFRSHKKEPDEILVQQNQNRHVQTSNKNSFEDNLRVINIKSDNKSTVMFYYNAGDNVAKVNQALARKAMAKSIKHIFNSTSTRPFQKKEQHENQKSQRKSTQHSRINTFVRKTDQSLKLKIKKTTKGLQSIHIIKKLSFD